MAHESPRYWLARAPQASNLFGGADRHSQVSSSAHAVASCALIGSGKASGRIAPLAATGGK